MKTRSSKRQRPKTEDSISRSGNQTQTLLHCTVYALSNTRTETLKFFGNWIKIIIIDYYMEFSLFLVHFVVKFFNSWDYYKYFVILRYSWKNVKSLEISRKFLRPGSSGSIDPLVYNFLITCSTNELIFQRVKELSSNLPSS